MTSKNSFFNLAYENSKRRIWNISLSILCLFFSLPIYAALRINVWNNRLSRKETTLVEIMEQFRLGIIGSVNEVLLVVTLLLAILLAFGGFSYMFSKSKTDLYHSLPLKRGKLFFVSYVNGIVYFAVPYLLFLVITLGIGNAYHLLSTVALTDALITFVLNLLGFIMLYTVSVVAIILTGNAIVALMANGVLLLYGLAVTSLINSYKATYFSSYYAGPAAEQFYYSPLTLYLSLMSSTRNGLGRYDDLFPLYLFSTIALILGLLLLSIFLYNKRPSETAGRSLAFEKTKPFIKILLMIPITTGCGWWFRTLTYVEVQRSANDVWLAFGLIVGLLLSHAVIEIIYQFDFKAAFHHLHHILIAGIVSAVVVCIFRFDLIGYDTYLPDANSIDTVAISSYDLHSETNYYYNFNSPEIYATGFDSADYVSTDDYRMENMKLTDTDAVLKLAQASIDDTKQMNDAINTHDDNWATLDFFYRLKNGRKVYRSYSVYLDKHIDLFDPLYTSEEYKKAVYTILTMTDDEIADYECTTTLGSVRLNTVMSDDEVKELIHIYQKELLAQTAYDLRDSYVVGRLYSLRATFRDSSYARESTVECNQGLIYSTFTETLAYMAAHGLDLYLYRDISNISSIEVNYYDYSSENGDSYNNEFYTDTDEIAELMEVLVPGTYSHADYVFTGFYNSFDVNVTYKSVPKGYNTSAYFTFRNKDYPDFIKRDFPYVE